MRLILKFLGACKDSESVEVARSSRPVRYSAHACGASAFRDELSVEHESSCRELLNTGGLA